MKKLNIHFIPDLLRWKISIRWSTVVIHLLAVPCTVVPIAASLNLSHSDATAVSALPAETSIPWNALLPCLLNLLMSSTAIVFLLLIKTFVTFFLKTVLCSTASFTVTSVVSRMFFKMNKFKWWRTWWRFWRGRLLYLLIQETSCRCARLRAGIFLFRRTPQAVFPIKETCAARRTTQISLRHWTQFNRIRYVSKKEELNAVLPFFVLYFVDFSYVFFCINDILLV